MVVACSLAAAVCLALATVFQQRAASRVPVRHALRPGLLLRVVREPLWLVGKVADTCALGLQALALSRGSLLVVQPLLALGLVVALGLDAAWSRRRPTPRELASALAITAGVTAFVLLDTGAGRPVAGLASWLVGGGVVAVAVVGCVALAARRGARGRGALYAAAGGLAYAVSGGLLKQLTGVWRGHAGLVPLSVSFAGFLLIGLVGTLLVQTAFQVAPLTATIGVLTAAEPVAAGVVGVVVFGERLGGSGSALGVAAVAVVAGVLTVWGILALSRGTALHDQARPLRA